MKCESTWRFCSASGDVDSSVLPSRTSNVDQMLTPHEALLSTQPCDAGFSRFRSEKLSLTPMAAPPPYSV